MNSTTAIRLNAVLSVVFFLAMLSVSFHPKNSVAPVTFIVAMVFAVLSFDSICDAIDTL